MGCRTQLRVRTAYFSALLAIRPCRAAISMDKIPPGITLPSTARAVQRGPVTEKAHPKPEREIRLLALGMPREIAPALAALASKWFVVGDIVLKTW